jgi:hypothetical protein
MSSSPFDNAIRRFDEENAKDPNSEIIDGNKCPRELVYAERLTEWVLKLSPTASESLRLAARCQHLCRWAIPRNQYEMNRAGYLKWRNDLKKFHAQKAGEILKEVGYDSETIQRVQDLNLKKNFPKDPESQTLEDALCLVFLQYQFKEFMEKNTEEKLIDIVQKTWKKMSSQAHSEALKLSLDQNQKTILDRALA